MIEPFKLAHSIPDMFAYAMTCDLGTVLATGDYKSTRRQWSGRAGGRRPPSWPSWAARASCSCSATRPTPTARLVAVGVVRRAHLEEAFARCKGRIVVTSFASNIHHVQSVVDAADAVAPEASWSDVRRRRT